MNKLYKKYIENIDMLDCDEVMRNIIMIISSSELESEQKMKCIGLLLNKNKEFYILSLKKEIFLLNGKLTKSENNYKKLKTRWDYKWGIWRNKHPGEDCPEIHLFEKNYNKHSNYNKSSEVKKPVEKKKIVIVRKKKVEQ